MKRDVGFGLILLKAVPAALAGLYALKPSLGLLEMSGIMPIRQVPSLQTKPRSHLTRDSPRFDCVGPMGK